MTEPLRLAYLAPGLGPCGGVRVLVEHCNRLAQRGHDVKIIAPQAIKPRWIEIKVPVIPLDVALDMPALDVAVATGWATVEWALRVRAARRFYFVQMMEYLFYPERSHNTSRARESYALAHDAGFEFITIARWLRDRLRDNWGISATIVPNGVNRRHFHRAPGRKKHAIIVEGDDRNSAKDIDHLSWEVALRLREQHNYELWGYSAIPHQYVDKFDQYVIQPAVRDMRRMYSQAQFMVKASRYEGRACAPVEAMCCGTPSVRAIIEGDDDLIDGQNCLRTGYNLVPFMQQARRLATDQELLRQLTEGARDYADTHLNWDDKITKLETLYG